MFGEDGRLRDGHEEGTPGVLRVKSESGEDASNPAVETRV